MSPRASRLATLVFAAAGLAVAGCNASASTPAGSQTVGNGSARDGGDSGELAVDASSESVPAVLLEGSPLCNAVPTSCNPDHPTTAKACGEAPDGGPYSPTGGYDNAVFACRVLGTPQDISTEASQNPTCASAGPAGDGSWCKSASECQPAFDCVGSGTCQQYCCSGNDECVADQFCDIQPTVASPSVEVPVCMPIHPASGCKLLDPKACPATKTCAVVRDNGATSCVSVGAARAGGECDTDHCAAGLVCLGTSGSRSCFLLCSTSTGGCLASQQCRGGLPLFPDPTVGICSPLTAG